MVTTLLLLVAVEVNGIDLHKDKKELEGVIGFVPQDDLLLKN